mmetsp:Transcript_6082/g.12518  ORF Transcript_6082/g.12518 Transcript_6082/m.12518 type:complete len:232 (+) Transcript_6082:105-800(+)
MSEIHGSISQKAKEFWYNSYNVETNWYGFYIPLSLWGGCWLYAKLSKKDFFKWTELHLLHHVGAMALGSLSLYYGDDSIVNERVPILWSLSYFAVDSIEALLLGHLTYVLHGTIALLLGLANYNLPILRSLRTNSKASYIETSSLLLPFVKRYRKPWLFGIFALIYTMCRIIWIPFMIRDLLNNGLGPSHPAVIGVGLFYCLNIYWYIKIVKIAVKGSEKDDETKSKTKKE